MTDYYGGFNKTSDGDIEYASMDCDKSMAVTFKVRISKSRVGMFIQPATQHHYVFAC